MLKSGHTHEYARMVFVEALLKFDQMTKNSMLDPSDPKFRPIYLSNEYEKEKRGIIKFLKRFSWHDPDYNLTDNSWREQIPDSIKQTGKGGLKRKGGGKTPLNGIICSKFK